MSVHNFIDLTGQKIHKLTVLERGPNDNRKCATWICRCDCGTIKTIRSALLRSEKTKTCGKCRQGPLKEKSPTWKGVGELSLTTWNHIKNHASMRRHVIEFNLDINYAWSLFLKQNRRCALTGLELSFDSYAFAADRTASLDRINSKGIYEEGNVQWVHKLVNIMKQDLSQEEFIEWCRRIAKYQSSISVSLI